VAVEMVMPFDHAVETAIAQRPLAFLKLMQQTWITQPVL